METPITNDPTASMTNGNGATQARSKAAELGQKAAGAIDAKRETLSRGMESAASRLHERADTLPGGEKIARAAHTAAGAMETAASYLRDHDLRVMLSDVRQIARKHPGATLATAAAIGFLLARSLTRR